MEEGGYSRICLWHRRVLFSYRVVPWLTQGGAALWFKLPRSRGQTGVRRGSGQGQAGIRPGSGRGQAGVRPGSGGDQAGVRCDSKRFLDSQSAPEAHIWSNLHNEMRRRRSWQ